MNAKAKARLQALLGNGFLRAASILAGGTAIAQAITLLALPVLTRLYSPEDFALLAVYTAILGMLSVVACLRLDIAIPLPQRDEDAANLLALSLLFAVIVGLVATFVVAFWPQTIVKLLKQPDLQPHLWLLPLGIWLTATYSAVQYWATRRKYFSAIAKTRIVQACLGSGTQVGVGAAGITPLGLLFGQLLLSGAGIIGLFRQAWIEDRFVFRNVCWAGMKEQLRTNDKFPKYSVLDSFANSAAIQLPLILIAVWAVGPEAGYLLLAMRVMNIPMGLIGKAMSQVYLSQVADEHRRGNLDKFTAKIVTGLAKASIGPLIFIGIVAPYVFPLVFGDNWLRAGELVMWMAPWMALQLIASPISMSMHVMGWQRIMLLMMVFGLLLRVGLVYAISQVNVQFVAEAYAVSGTLFYGLYCFACFRCSGVRRGQVWFAIKSSVPVVMFFSVMGLVVAHIARMIA